MSREVPESLENMGQLARRIDDQEADSQNGLTNQERDDLKRESRKIRMEMSELARGIFDATSGGFAEAKNKLDGHVQTLSSKLTQLRRAAEIADDVKNIAASVDELLALASSIASRAKPL